MPSTEDQIKQAVQDYFLAYEECGAAPAACDPASFTAEQGKSRSTVTALVSGMSRDGLRFSEDLRGSYVTVESVQQSEPLRATASACWFDAAVVLGPVGPDGNPTVIDDQILSYR
ncbi:MAG TPA: hypothetical protein VLD86_08790, partial [Ilumatobacteraceae bacterium]|nr:hypothetical protein [Ilumatobacteraceae bacterium]